jgi:ribose transport system substrate-binding protein
MSHRRKLGFRGIRRGCDLRLLAVGVLAAALLAGCGSPSDGQEGQDGERVNIAMFLVATANTHQQAAVEGAEAAIKADGNARLWVFGAEFDPRTQVNQIETAIASGQYDAFIVNSVDGTTTVDAIEKAADAGITVVCGFSVCGADQGTFSKQTDGAVAQISTDYGALGEAQAHALTEACKDVSPCNTVYIDGAPTLAAEMTVTKAFEATIASASNIHVVAHAEGQYLSDPAYESMKDVLQAHPDINAVVSPGDQMIDGARRALDESPLADEEVYLIGDGASELAAKGIGSGSWYASAILRPFTEGELGAQAAMDAARGGQVEELVNSSLTDGIPELYLSRASLEEFKPEWKG